MLRLLGRDKTTRYLIFFFVFLFISMIFLSLNGDVSNNNYNKKRYREINY